MSGNTSRRGPWWELFESTGTKFSQNESYQNAWCRACLSQHIQRNQQFDENNVALGLMPGVRPYEQLKRLALGPKAYTPDELARNPFSEFDEQNAIVPIYGRATTMSAHARRCPNTDRVVVEDVSRRALQKKEAEARARTRLAVSTGRDENSPSAGFATTPLRLPHRHPDGSSLGKRARQDTTPSGSHSFNPIWDDACQQEFAADLCKVFIANAISWNVADNPQFLHFFSKWLPAADMPSRRSLSGTHLNEAVEQVKQKVLLRVEGKTAVGQSDGWKNVAKTNVTSTIMSVNHEPYLVRTHNMTGRPKTGDEMLQIILADIRYMETTYKVKVVGWCTDDGPDGKKARRLLLDSHPHLIVLFCWAHQINLIVGDMLNGVPWITDTMHDTVDIVNWFNNHGVALDLLRREQLLTRPIPYALIRPVLTRWTSHFLSCTRLLLLESDMRSCVFRHSSRIEQSVGTDTDALAKVRTVLDRVRSDGFWVNLKRMRECLEPLAVASNIMQGSDTRLDHVLLTLGHLYKVYSRPGFDPAVSTKVLAGLEARWKKTDQDPFILSVFMNPYIRGHCFSRRALLPIDLIDMARRGFKRFFEKNTDSYFLRGLLDYSNGRSDFAPAKMLLSIFRDDARNEGKRVDVKQIWETLDAAPEEVSPGVEGIAQLGYRLASVVGSTGDTERTFSFMGKTHTASRSRLSPEKVHKAVQVQMYLLRAQQEATPGSNRRARRFGDSLTGLDNCDPARADYVMSTPTPSRFATPSTGQQPLPSLQSSFPSSPPAIPPLRAATSFSSGSPSSTQPTPGSSGSLPYPASSMVGASSGLMRHASDTSMIDEMGRPNGRLAEFAIPHVYPQDVEENPFDRMAEQLMADAHQSWVDGPEESLSDDINPGDAAFWNPPLHADALALPEEADATLLDHIAIPVRLRGPRARNRTCIPLAQLFVYDTQPSTTSIPDTARLDLFWADGVQGLQAEATEMESLEGS